MHWVDKMETEGNSRGKNGNLEGEELWVICGLGRQRGGKSRMIRCSPRPDQAFWVSRAANLESIKSLIKLSNRPCGESESEKSLPRCREMVQFERNTNIYTKTNLLLRRKEYGTSKISTLTKLLKI